MPPLAVCAVAADDHVADVVALGRLFERCGAFTPRYLHIVHDAMAPAGAAAVAGSFGAPYVPHDVTVECLRGLPAPQLQYRAEQLGAALFIVGSSGRSPVMATLLGSTSRRLLHHAELPVVIARGVGEPEDRDGPVVCGVAGPRADARHVARHAAGLAQRMGRPLVVATVASPLDAARRRADDAALWLDVPDGLETAALEGAPAARLADLAEACRAPLLVVGCRRAGVVGTMFGGSVSAELTRAARRPVAVVPLQRRHAG
jgi:nucleotide-binding universal stress UspA family protein